MQKVTENSKIQISAASNWINSMRLWFWAISEPKIVKFLKKIVHAFKKLEGFKIFEKINFLKILLKFFSFEISLTNSFFQKQRVKTL